MYKTLAEIETRKAAILQEMEQEGADLDALKKEMDELRENAQQLRDAAAKAEETRKAIASGAAGIVIGETRQAERRLPRRPWTRSAAARNTWTRSPATW